jgi:hypothetical protein
MILYIHEHCGIGTRLYNSSVLLDLNTPYITNHVSQLENTAAAMCNQFKVKRER